MIQKLLEVQYYIYDCMYNDAHIKLLLTGIFL